MIVEKRVNYTFNFLEKKKEIKFDFLVERQIIKTMFNFLLMKERLSILEFTLR